ncbi:hypothetical protein Tco_0470265, partial [Tanacetum coccineum]
MAVCVRMRPIYSAKLKLLGSLALLSNLSISTNHFFNHLSFYYGRWIDLWTPEDCKAGILLNFYLPSLLPMLVKWRRR